MCHCALQAAEAGEEEEQGRKEEEEQTMMEEKKGIRISQRKTKRKER